MNEIQSNKQFLFKRWQSLRLYNIVIHAAFLFFYSVGTIQSYSYFAPPAVFNLPLILPLGAIFLSAYIVHCLINHKDKQCLRLIPILTLFTTLFITINSHFEVSTSQNSFLYFTLLLPLFYAYTLSFSFRLLITNNVIALLSYTFTAVVGDTSTLVFLSNLVFLFGLGFLTIYSHLKNNTHHSEALDATPPRTTVLTPKDSTYLRSIIHDIRQPLSSLSLYSQLLKEQSDAQQQKIIIKNLVDSSSQLEHWLSSLLELTTLNSRSIEAKAKNIPIETCLAPLIDKYKQQAQTQGMRLRTRISRGALYTDKKLLVEIVDSLLSNALIHGSHEKNGSILLSARTQRDGINIQVWNKGERIRDEHLKSLFDELYYSKNPNHNKAKGVGLGLALSQQKAALLNTKIEVRTSDNGSCFSIKVAKGAHSELPTSHLKQSLRQDSNQQILLVDDDQSILAALSMLLQNWGYQVRCAKNSRQATQLLELEQFSLIISDYRLPDDKTGIELINFAKQKQDIHALLLTGDIEPEGSKEGQLKNYKMLHKPIKPAKLRLLLRQVLSE